MSRHTILLLLSIIPSLCFTCESPSFDVAVLGFGGRSQGLLLECLKLKNEVRKEINVVAICDDHAKESLQFYLKKLDREQPALAQGFKKMVENAIFYPDTAEGLEKLFFANPVDKIFITSPNYHHLRHINAVLEHSACKNIFIEKPLFRSLDEFNQFKATIDDVNINVGLTLRYSNMARIVNQKLREHMQQLGTLKNIKGWEHVNFGHALTIILMNWRRYISLSGGLLLEKSIHDLDLALFFINSLGIEFKEFFITSNADHKLFKKSNKNTLLNTVLQDQEVRKSAERWETKAWQRYFDFVHDANGAIDWHATLDAFFEEFPEDDNFDNSDIISDYHKLNAIITTEQGTAINLELEVDLSNGKPTTDRGVNFRFEHGTVYVDIMKSTMHISLDNGTEHEYDLQTQNNSHAGGDVYVAHTILNTLPEGQHKATFNDPMVQLSTLLGLLSEHQVQQKTTKPIIVKKNNNTWTYEFATIG